MSELISAGKGSGGRLYRSSRCAALLRPSRGEGVKKLGIFRVSGVVRRTEQDAHSSRGLSHGHSFPTTVGRKCSTQGVHPDGRVNNGILASSLLLPYGHQHVKQQCDILYSHRNVSMRRLCCCAYARKVVYSEHTRSHANENQFRRSIVNRQKIVLLYRKQKQTHNTSPFCVMQLDFPTNTLKSRGSSRRTVSSSASSSCTRQFFRCLYVWRDLSLLLVGSPMLTGFALLLLVPSSGEL